MAVGHTKSEQDTEMKYERRAGPEVKGKPRGLTIWA